MPNFNGQDVGQISIKVVPNLDGFRAELRRKLKAIEDSVRGEVHVDVKADITGVREKIEALSQDTDAEINVHADTAGVREEIEAAARDTTAHINVEVDHKSLDRFQRRMLREIESAMAQIEPKLHLTPDGEKLRRDLEKLTHTLKQKSHFEVATDLGIAAGQREKLAAEVKAAKEYAEKFAGPLEFKTTTDKEQFAFHNRLRALRKQLAAEDEKMRRRVQEVNDRTAAEDIAHAREIAKVRERSAKTLKALEDRHAATRHRNEMRDLKERLNESIKAFNDQEVQVKASLDELSLEKTLARARALAAQAGIPLDVEVHDEKAKADLAKTLAELDLIARSHPDLKVKVKVDYDHNRINKAADGVITTFRKNMLKGLSRFGRVLSDDTTLIAAAILSLGAPLMGTVTAAIAGLPALLSAIAVPAAAAAFGINGIKKALVDTGIAIEDEKDGLKLGPIFDGIKASISEVFSNGLTPVFTKLLDLLPTLEAGLKPVAQAMVNTAGAITDVVTSARGLKITENILGNVAKLGDALAPGWAKATEAIMELADRGSNHLKGLGDWFTALMDRVKNAVDSVISSGAFDKAISGLKPILQGLANAIGNIFSTAFDWISNPANSQRFGEFIEQLGSLVKGALKISEVIFPILERLGEYIGNLVDQFSASGTLDLRGLGNKIWHDIFQAAPWGDLGKEIGLGIIRGLVGVFSSGVLLNAIPWQEVIGGAQMAFQVLTSAVSSGMQSAVQTVVSKAGEIVSEVGSWPSRIVGALGDLGSLLVGIGESLVQGLINGIKNKIGSVMSTIKDLANKIPPWLRGPLGVHSPSTVFLEIGTNLMAGLETGIEQGFGAVLAKTKDLAARIQEAMNSGQIATNLGPFKQEYQRQMDALQLTRQQLEIQLEGTEDKAQKKALREQLSQLANAREMLQLQSQQLRLNDRYGEGLVDQNQLMTDMLGKMTQAGQAFGMANAQQVMSDLGISGQGAIPQLADIGLGFASQMVGQLLKGGMGGTTIQVNSADEAFATYQRVNNQQALKYNRR